jgi:hypothetical protein
VKQIWLPVFDLPDADPLVPPGSPLPAAEEVDGPGVPVLPGQLALFGRITELLGDLHRAIEEGDFARARRLRRSLVAAEGPSRDARAVAVVDTLGRDAFWQRHPAEILADWRRLDARLPAGSPMRAWVRAAVVHRLTRSLGTRELVALVPDCLPVVANVLVGDAGPAGGEDGASEAREVVRDALLAGHSPAPGEFEDALVADLLAEDLDPAWMACLGALRHLWPCPPPDERDLDQVRTGVAGAGAPGEDGLRFWSCLKVVAHVRDEEALRRQARMRMKRLHADLHALVLRQPSLAR